MSFIEEWFPPGSCLALRRLVESTKGLSGRVIEVGSWEGRSTVHLAHGAWPTVVDAVDTWEGSPGELSAELAADPDRDVFATFLENMTALTRGNVNPHRMDWRTYFASDHGPVRFIHIDGLHTYDEVAATIETVQPLMVAGGIICGDDMHHLPVINAVNDTLGGDVRTEATLWIWEA